MLIMETQQRDHFLPRGQQEPAALQELSCDYSRTLPCEYHVYLPQYLVITTIPYTSDMSAGVTMVRSTSSW